MYAIIRVGGKQYRVEENTSLLVDKLEGNVGDDLTISDVLAVGGNDSPVFGSPVVSGASVVAKIAAAVKGPKIDGFTYKAKKNVHRHYGHRQNYTKIQITSIALGK